MFAASGLAHHGDAEGRFDGEAGAAPRVPSRGVEGAGAGVGAGGAAASPPPPPATGAASVATDPTGMFSRPAFVIPPPVPAKPKPQGGTATGKSAAQAREAGSGSGTTAGAASSGGATRKFDFVLAGSGHSASRGAAAGAGAADSTGAAQANTSARFKQLGGGVRVGMRAVGFSCCRRCWGGGTDQAAVRHVRVCADRAWRWRGARHRARKRATAALVCRQCDRRLRPTCGHWCVLGSDPRTPQSALPVWCIAHSLTPTSASRPCRSTCTKRRRRMTVGVVPLRLPRCGCRGWCLQRL